MKLKNVSIDFPAVACNPTLDDDSPNPFWPDIVLTRVLGISAPHEDGDRLVFTGITNLTRLDLPKMLALVGGVPQVFDGETLEVHGYPCWLELDPANKADDMPAFTPGGTVAVDEETSRPKRWEELATYREVDGKAYVACSDGVDYWPGTVLLQLSGTGHTLVPRPPAQSSPE